MKRDSVLSMRRLAGAGAAGDHDIEPRLHAAADKIEHAGGEGLVLQQVFGGQQLLAVAPDDITGPISESGGITAQTREPSSRRASTMGEESSMRRPTFDDDAVDDHAHVRLVLETDVGFDQPPAALDVDVVEAVDHDVADGGSLSSGSSGPRPKTSSRISSMSLSRSAIVMGQRFVDDQPLHHVADLGAHAVLVQRP